MSSDSSERRVDVPEATTSTTLTVAVIGAGTMGSGIATLLVQHGHRVTVYDTSEASLERTERRVAKRAGGEGALRSLRLSTDLAAAVAGATFVIEAVPEVLDLKRDLFAQLSRHADPDAVLATNTSELSVTAIAAAATNPGRVVGMHWFNPPERMRLVELVRALQTHEATVDRARSLAESCDKTTVTVNDRQGFVTTRAVAALVLEGVRMLEDGVAAREEIDVAVKLGLNHPMGPLELADYIGLDTLLLIAESMREALGERFMPPQLLRKLVEAGHHGRKSGRGFYEYEQRP